MSLGELPNKALRDVEKIFDYYHSEANSIVDERFLAALREALALIAGQPKIGSSRMAKALNRPTFRVWPMRDFPYLICYHERNGFVEIWRVLHTSRDIPSTLQE